ncbi:hypothetical protein G7046_g10094 [Stylonectria norvegica]|nr:hypothetical protein G7046_g10094 [Stylonectria norvegica]
MLRGKPTGRNKDGKGRRKVEESESDEEVGRSALGKRKRPRREVQKGDGIEDETVDATELPVAVKAEVVKEGAEEGSAPEATAEDVKMGETLDINDAQIPEAAQGGIQDVVQEGGASERRKRNKRMKEKLKKKNQKSQSQETQSP